MNRKIRKRLRDLNHAASYEAWREIALELDVLEGAADWKADEASADYDHWLIRDRMTELRKLRQRGETRKLVFTLHEGLHGNLGNIANPQLYTHARVGTKRLIEEYLREVEAALNFICDNEFDDFSDGDKLLFFKRTGSSFGRSALMLSGGATLGLFHLGVIKSLWSEGLLPRVISGSSAGSIVAGIVGTHADDELENIFDPDNLSLRAWSSLDFRDAISNRSLMDSKALERCIADNVGDMTFEEAFEHTRRIIGITVSPADPNQQGRLLNYLTSPNVLIRRASVASCAIPGIFPPVTLEAKSYGGEVQPYLPSKRWVDGSLRSDLPMLRLARMHNVNHYIVSQTNPHVVPFMEREKQRKTGLVPFARELVSSSYSVYSKHLIEVARQQLHPDGMGRIVEKLHSVTHQKYSGDVNIFPTHSPRKLMRMFSNPTPEDIMNFINEGERATWPHLERINNATRVSRTFEECLQRLKDRGVGREPLTRRLGAAASRRFGRNRAPAVAES